MADRECRRRRRALNGTTPLCLILIIQSLRRKPKRYLHKDSTFNGRRRRSKKRCVFGNTKLSFI